MKVLFYFAIRFTSKWDSPYTSESTKNWNKWNSSLKESWDFKLAQSLAGSEKWIIYSFWVQSLTYCEVPRKIKHSNFEKIETCSDIHLNIKRLYSGGRKSILSFDKKFHYTDFFIRGLISSAWQYDVLYALADYCIIYY